MGAASSITSRDTKGLLFRALRDGKNVHRKEDLTLEESQMEIQRYRAALRRWVVEAGAFQFSPTASPAATAKKETLENLDLSDWKLEEGVEQSPPGRLRPDFAEELLESNWKARTVERFYETKRQREEQANNVISFVLPMLSIQDWVPSALVCKNWTRVCRSADDLWTQFLFDLVRANLKNPEVEEEMEVEVRWRWRRR